MKTTMVPLACIAMRKALSIMQLEGHGKLTLDEGSFSHENISFTIGYEFVSRGIDLSARLEELGTLQTELYNRGLQLVYDADELDDNPAPVLEPVIQLGLGFTCPLTCLNALNRVIKGDLTPLLEMDAESAEKIGTMTGIRYTGPISSSIEFKLEEGLRAMQALRDTEWFGTLQFETGAPHTYWMLSPLKYEEYTGYHRYDA